jgi:hypothetical protein
METLKVKTAQKNIHHRIGDLMAFSSVNIALRATEVYVQDYHDAQSWQM